MANCRNEKVQMTVPPELEGQWTVVLESTVPKMDGSGPRRFASGEKIEFESHSLLLLSRQESLPGTEK